MEANVYFFSALVSTGIFLLQFILSIFFGSMDTDIDVNADGNADIDMSSVLSFKGLIHFCMGFGWFMYLCQPPYIVLHYLGAVISGSFFVFVLAWIYKLCYKLKQENKPEQGEELIGRKCEIYTPLPGTRTGRNRLCGLYRHQWRTKRTYRAEHTG